MDLGHQIRALSKADCTGLGPVPVPQRHSNIPTAKALLATSSAVDHSCGGASVLTTHLSARRGCLDQFSAFDVLLYDANAG